MVSGEEFRLQGTSNVEEVLNRLPQVNPSEGEFVSAGAMGIATVDLRGLGALRTLVLVNGRRLMPGDPRFSVADLNSIPAPLIQRVEVLTGGAAAVYGSDAVAGVVNFILDNRLEGLRVEGNISAYQHNNRDRFVQGLLEQRHFPYPNGSVIDGWRGSASAAFGHSFSDSRGHIELYAGYRRIAGLTQDRRDYSSCSITAVIVRQKPTDQIECGGALLAYPGNFFDNLGNAYQVTADRTFVPGLGRFNITPWNFYQRPDTRCTAGGFADFHFSNAVQAYAEVMAMWDRSIAQTSPSGNATNTETINCDNPLLSAQQRSLICRRGNFVGEVPIFDSSGNLIQIVGTPTPFVDPVTGMTYSRGWLLVSRRSVESGAIQDDQRHRSIRLIGGLKGDLGRGVNYDASYLFGHVSLDEQLRNLLSISRLGKALDIVTDPSTSQPVCRSVLIARELGSSAPGADSNCVPWDIFAPGQVSPQSVAYLILPVSTRGSFEQRIANANATIELDRWGIRSPWSDEGPAINIGAEHRTDSVDFAPDASSQSGDIAGFTPQVSPIHGSVSTSEIFGEAGFRWSPWALCSGWRSRAASASRGTTMEKQVLDRRIQACARPDARHLGCGSAPASNVPTVPRTCRSYLRRPRPVRSIATGAPADSRCFRSAMRSDWSYARAIWSYPGGPVVGLGLQFGHRRQRRAAARNCDHTHHRFGARAANSSKFNLTLDWWDIGLDGAIAQVGAQIDYEQLHRNRRSFFCSRIHRDPNGSLWLGNGYVDDRQANIGSLRVRGVDIGADYSAPVGRWGSAHFEFHGSYVLRWITDKGGFSMPYDCVGLFGDPCGIQPRWKHVARATWDTPSRHSLSINWRHTSGVTLAALDPKFNLTDSVSAANTRLAAQDYFDLATRLRIRREVELRLGVNNIFDRQPPRVVRNTAAGVGPVNGNTYPEWYDALGRYIFASATMNFRP